MFETFRNHLKMRVKEETMQFITGNTYVIHDWNRSVFSTWKQHQYPRHSPSLKRLHLQWMRVKWLWCDYVIMQCLFVVSFVLHNYIWIGLPVRIGCGWIWSKPFSFSSCVSNRTHHLSFRFFFGNVRPCEILGWVVLFLVALVNFTFW